MAMRFRTTTFIILLFAFLIAAVAVKLGVNYCLTHFARRSGPLVTLSKETTCITEPLGPEGFPDYIAALNHRDGDGVTPENNAVVPFFRAMGPEMVEREFRDQYCKLLGAAPPPAKGDYFVDLIKYAAALDPAKFAKGGAGASELEKQYYSLMKRPWRAADFPLIAKWLAAQQQPLDRVVEASARPRWYSPLVSNGYLLVAPVPAQDKLRAAAHALVARAMQRVQDGKTGEAWSDLLAVHRLARLAGHGPTLLDSLVAVGLNDVACEGDQALLQHVRLTAAQAARMRAELAALPPMAKMVDKIDVGERFTILDATVMLARGKGASFQQSNKIAANPTAIDWDAVLRMSNKWYDRIAAAGRQGTRAQRAKACAEIDADLKDQVKAATSWTSLVKSVLLDPRQGITENFGLIMVSMLLPAADMLITVEEREDMRLALTRLAFALAEYRAGHGSYPAKLADLVPKYVAAVPRDIFSGGELRYKPRGDGYLLYSVGPNGKDDGGRNREDDPNDATLVGCDDIAVHIPAKSK
jgi:hypothetical protein